MDLIVAVAARIPDDLERLDLPLHIAAGCATTRSALKRRQAKGPSPSSSVASCQFTPPSPETRTPASGIAPLQPNPATVSLSPQVTVKPSSGAVISDFTGMSVITAKRLGSSGSPGATGAVGRR